MLQEDRKIKVVSYSGYRGEEIPRSFKLGDEIIEVVNIIRMWIEEDQMSRKRLRGFHLKGSDGSEHSIYYDEKSAEWYYKVR